MRLTFPRVVAISAVVTLTILCLHGRHLSDVQRVDESRMVTGIMLILAGYFFLSRRKSESDNRKKKVALGEMTHAQANKKDRDFSQLAWGLTFVGIAWTGYLIFWVYGITNVIDGITDYFS